MKKMKSSSFVLTFLILTTHVSMEIEQQDTKLLFPIFDSCLTFIPKTYSVKGVNELKEYFYHRSANTCINQKYFVITQRLYLYPVFHKYFDRSENVIKIPFKFANPCIAVISTFISILSYKSTHYTMEMKIYLQIRKNREKQYLFVRKPPVTTFFLLPMPTDENTGSPLHVNPM